MKSKLLKEAALLREFGEVFKRAARIQDEGLINASHERERLNGIGDGLLIAAKRIQTISFSLPEDPRTTAK